MQAGRASFVARWIIRLCGYKGGFPETVDKLPD